MRDWSTSLHTAPAALPLQRSKLHELHTRSQCSLQQLDCRAITGPLSSYRIQSVIDLPTPSDTLPIMLKTYSLRQMLIITSIWWRPVTRADSWQASAHRPPVITLLGQNFLLDHPLLDTPGVRSCV